MADQSHIAKTLFDALPAAEETGGWWNAPVLDGWSLDASPNSREVAVVGIMSGSEKLGNGSSVRTDPLHAVDGDRRFVLTQNSVYQLGWPHRVTLDPDANQAWPPVLHVAASANWQAAFSDAMRFTGDTISEGAHFALMISMYDDEPWQDRRAALNAIAQELFRADRFAVAEAWMVLGTDLRLGSDRYNGGDLVAVAARHVDRTSDRDITANEAFAAKGWKVLASMDDAQAEKLPWDGVPIDDPIAAAHKVALISLRARPQLKPSVSFVDPEIEDGEKPGLIADLSNVSSLLTANNDDDSPAPLKGRLQVIRLPRPGPEHIRALARFTTDIARERCGDPRWWPESDEVELAITEKTWDGGSIHRLRAVVERIVAMRERATRH
jgi:hypothetical protein